MRSTDGRADGVLLKPRTGKIIIMEERDFLVAPTLPIMADHDRMTMGHIDGSSIPHAPLRDVMVHGGSFSCPTCDARLEIATNGKTSHCGMVFELTKA